MYKNHILMDGISDMIFVVNAQGDSIFTYEFLNRAAMEKTGLTEDIIGKKIETL
ncbi:hypothetical protein [Ornithinibacillus halotolerans]|uniref:PAS domain-containing protein n=1 Tax=Ornithinibacillus halotolerans TaxID=1274357 RepID=A0A916RU80_9BACI|nr:hypothetical protein [Ornithinibacillus halotolerans]GGA70662.1 hypothetical protein GCM10008025_13130 [Ornithinibacillus halotolerans]